MSVTPPSGPSSVSSPSDNEPGFALKLLFQILRGNSDPVLDLIGQEVYPLVQNIDSSNAELIESTIQSYLDCPHPDESPGDTLMYFAQQGLGNVSGSLQTLNDLILYVTQPYGGWIPNIQHTPMDDLFINLASWNCPADMTSLYNNIRSEIYQQIGSNGSISGDLFPYIQNILTDPNFFTNYPNLNGQDLASLLQICTYPAPDYINYYLSLGYKSSPTPLEQDLLQEMGNVWATGNLQTLKEWFARTIADPRNYGASVEEIKTLAQDIGISLPDSFFTYYEGMKNLLPDDPSSDDYRMIVDFQSQWIQAYFTEPDFQTWFKNNFGAPGETCPPGVEDLYMCFPLADASLIQSMVNVFFSGTYTETSLDSVYRSLYADHGSDSSGLYYDFFNMCRVIGSSDANQSIERWIDDQALSGFPQYSTTPDGISEIVDFLNNFPWTVNIGPSQYNYMCEFITGYIQEIWLKDPSRTAADKKFGQQLVIDIQTWGPFSSFDDLKNFIAGRVPTYLKLDPGGDPPGSTVINFLEMFELYTPPQGE